MGTPAIADVVLVRFPFSDLSSAKVRPAIVIADAGRGDWILCQITSNPYGDPGAIALSDADFATGGLLIASFARPGKLFTANGSMIIRTVGSLKHAPFKRIRDAMIKVVCAAEPPSDGTE
jgi:mRNA interferase MazF